MDELMISLATAADSAQIAVMIEEVFMEFNAASMLPEGQAEFLEFIRPGNISSRLSAGACMFVAHYGGQLAGVIEVRIYSHVALLFTARRYHRQGVAKALLGAALARCREVRPNLKGITVNSSDYAIPIYERLGFIRRDKAQIKLGVRYTPMVLPF